ncbi:MAG TPA: hypothetical protein VMX97_11640 [Hyphomicrobiaceae bacterium]|nr:hypothetical protein [Hyphomicrobiaceae bacterium]
MPQIIALALVGAGVYAGYRWLRKQTQQVAADAALRREAAEQADAGVRDGGELEWDAAEGVYRPRRDGPR